MLDELRKKLESAPQDFQALQSLGAALSMRLEEQESPSNDLSLEAIDVFSRIVSLKPDDIQALRALADISFSQRVFDKAAQYYERYLSLNAQDLDTKAQYASTLSFLNRFDDAEKVLNEILQKNPKDFHAQAYLAITSAQRGDSTKALEIGKKAVDLAPSEEARARFERFLDSLGPSGNTSLERISDFLRKNPITGRKFIRGEVVDDTIRLYFVDFPMSAMPPVAKEKFYSSLKPLAKEGNSSKIEFIDERSRAVLDRVEVQ